MFDIGALELLVIAIVAVIVIGPKDMPLAMRTAGRWIGKIRRVSAQFRGGIDAMVREAELEEMDAKWKKQNAEIMAKYPNEPADVAASGPGSADSHTEAGEFHMEPLPPEPEPPAAPIAPASAEAAALPESEQKHDPADEPQLPFGPDRKG